MKRLVAATALFVALARPAPAHEGGHHVMGTIKEVTAQQIVVTDKAGKVTTFAITTKTEFFRERKPVRREDAKVGERVAVHGEMAGATMDATEVMLGGSTTPAK